MSLYNIMNGVNPATFLILPMLGKHPDEYPRFRDCFLEDPEHPAYNDHIHVYTRVGGGNRDAGYGEEELYKHPNYEDTFDDDFDNTFATYVFSIPDEFKEDYEKIKKGDFKGTSEAYKDICIKVFPKLKEQLETIFNRD